jgi:cytochrome bd-type quinol oxidase subunit 2
MIAAATLLGALWAGFNLWLVGAARDASVFRQLIWVVFATPFATFCGWAWARPRERWAAAFFSFMVYFLAILVAARVERFVLGRDTADATQHALYFRLTLALDLLGGLAIALQRARSVSTIPTSKEPAVHSITPNS